MTMSQTKAKAIKKKEEAIRSPMPLIYLVLGVVVLVAILAAILLLPSLYGEQASAEKVLGKFYSGLYGGNFDEMPKCLPEELRDTFTAGATLGGIGTNIYTSYVEDMQKQVGENVTVSVKVTKDQSGGASSLNQYQSSFSKVSEVNQVSFEVTCKGDSGKVTQAGTVDMVKVGKNWYMSTYNVELSKIA